MEELQETKATLGGKTEMKLHGSKEFCLFESMENGGSEEIVPSSRLSISRSLSKPVRSSVGKPLTPEEILQVSTDRLIQENVLQRMPVFSSVSQGEIYDLDSVKLIVVTLVKEKEAEDRRVMEQGIRPRSFPDFLVNLLARSGKQQDEGLRHVAMLVNSVRDYSQRSVPSALLFAKLFHLHSLEAISYQTALVLPRLAKEFANCAESYYREKGTRTGEFHLEMDDRARLGDILSMVYRDFAEDPFSGGHLTMLLKPSNVSQEDYQQFVFMHKVFMSGKTLEETVEAIAGFDRAQVEVDVMVRGCKRQLDMWLSEYDLKSLLSRFDHNSDGEVDVFDLQPLSSKCFPPLQSQDAFTISACEFLTAVEEVARERNLRIAREVIRGLGQRDKPVTSEDIQQKLYQFSIDSKTAEFLWEESKRNREEVLISDIVSTFVRFPSGDWEKGPLVVRGLLQMQEPVAVESLLAQAGNILEDSNEDE